MDNVSNLKYKWLRFSAKSGVFGTLKQHLGFIIGENEENLFCVAVYVTSQWDYRDQARIRRNDPEATIVWILANSEKGAYHFKKDSVIDCAFPKKISYSDLQECLNDGSIELLSTGIIDVPKQLLDEVRTGILASRQVSNIIKHSL